MRARWWMPALLIVALSVPVRAGDTGKPAADAKAPAAKDAPAAKEKKPAAAPVVAPVPIVRPAPKDLDEALRRLSRVKVTVKFKDTPFAEAVDYVRRVAGFNVMVSPVLSAKGLDAIQPITMTLNDVSLKQLAELVAQFSSTKLKLDGGILQFTTPEDARGKPVLRIYAIGDLTMKLRNFPGPDINLRPSGAEFEDEPETDVENAWSDPQKVIDLIQKTCAEDSWTDKDVSISADEQKLIVKQYPEVHREIGRLIWMLRSAR
jgi:hypothetical protein